MLQVYDVPVKFSSNPRDVISALRSTSASLELESRDEIEVTAD